MTVPGLMRPGLSGIISGLVLVMLAALPGDAAHAQSRAPSLQEVKAIRDCAAKNRDDLDAGEQQCLFKLVADPCIGPPGRQGDGPAAQCYQIETAIWDKLLNGNYKTLLGELDDEQAAKARAMQRAWLAYRDTTCTFYQDKIQGSMAYPMQAACVARETARRAMVLDFFSRL
ncbi:MAG: lysozyme inhibitor LprI family protein [Xanthobacteraceae bacterium]